MMKPRLPEGIREEDYEAIEAAVMETARGRWFLAEFARRSHVAEMKQMLDAMARLEQVVTTPLTTPADPSIRLLVSRLKEVGEQLGSLVSDMRTAGIDEHYCDGIEAQARALGSLLRLNAGADPARLKAPPRESARSEAARILPAAAPAVPAHSVRAFDERLAALADIDALPTREKLRLFA